MTAPIAILASLSPETRALLDALPRGVRITRERLIAIAAAHGSNERSALLRIAALNRSGFVEEFPARDGSGQTLRSEWEVRS